MKRLVTGWCLLAVMQGMHAAPTIQLLTLDPGHFHAALVQKSMYPQVDPTVHVYSPGGADLDLHLQRINGFNTRAENPTEWKEVVYTGPDYLEKMLKEKRGNVVVISGNNSLKGKYILECVKAGLNVLSDKPMAITPADYRMLKEAFATAPDQHAVLYDIMPERSEIASVLQRELARNESVFGTIEPGTPDNPSVIQEDVHYFEKEVAGKPLIRPAWFFDVKQQGEGIVDVTTHLVDLVQCSLFPKQVLSPKDVDVLSARSWNTELTPEEFTRITQLKDYPDYLKPYIDDKGSLQVRCNGSFIYTLRGIHVRVSTEWRVKPPPGMGDTHFALMRGSRANLVIRQGQEEEFVPTLYVIKRSDVPDAEFEASLKKGIEKLSTTWPGISVTCAKDGWKLLIPEQYRFNHEARFAKVASLYFDYLAQGKPPEWEEAGILTKYQTLMQAYELSLPKSE